VLEVSDYFAAVVLSAQTALRESIGRAELAAMITERERLGAQLRGICLLSRASARARARSSALN
jgi:regulator of protease activity HflC (stomatin/prohibitin superfamily)